MNRVFVCGDTHGGAVGDLDKLTSRKFPEGKELTKNDYVIIAGDFGFIWDVNRSGKAEADKHKWFEEKPWTTLFLDGNHENFDLINALPTAQRFGADVGVAASSVFHLRRGRCYTIGGQTFLTIGGGLSIDKHHRTEGVSWWAEEMLSELDLAIIENTLEVNNYEFDYVLTHTCSTKVKNYMLQGQRDIFDITSEQLSYIEDRISFKKWYFAHFHIGENYYSKYNDEEPTHVCLYEDIMKLGGQYI